MSLKKSVLVTGSAARLGATLARFFAMDGWRVFCHYDKSRAAAEALIEELRNAGSDALALQADLSSEDGCRQLVAKVKSHVERLDCLVNNASAFEPDSATDFDSVQALRQLQVNLLAPLSLTRWMAQDLVAADATIPSCVIHVLDQKVFNLNPDYFTYTISKLALERAVALQAQALAPRIRVCGVAPGLMYASGPQSRENFEQAAKANLLKRATDPDDVARTCLFLASNGGITGATVSVDNGQHLVPLPRDIMFVVEELLKVKSA